jgi:hypothetical protein
MKLWIQQCSFDTALTGVSKITLVVKDIVDAIHQKVIGNEKEDCSNNQWKINSLVHKPVSRKEWKCGVHPRDRPGR